MKPLIDGEGQMKRFRRWHNLLPQKTRLLTNEVELKLVPILKSHGFKLVDVRFHQTDFPVSGKEIHMERDIGEAIDGVTINFSKNLRPKFQVHISRRKLGIPPDFLRHANLVARSSQYYHFWGVPFWCPTSLWSDRCSSRTVDIVTAKADQMLGFLDTGFRGQNVSKQV